MNPRFVFMKCARLLYACSVAVMVGMLCVDGNKLERARHREQALLQENLELINKLTGSTQETTAFAKAYLAALEAKVDCERLVETLSKPSYASIP